MMISVKLMAMTILSNNFSSSYTTGNEIKPEAINLTGSLRAWEINSPIFYYTISVSKK
jgi:hypothetical protein